MTQSIAAITLLVPDYDAGIAFYVHKLGFDLLEDTRLSETKRWVRVAPKGAQTALLLAKANGEAQAAAIGQQTGGRVGFFLHTDDFARDYTAMTAAGVTFLETPRREPYGTVVVFQDPFGNKWDLIEPSADSK
jgi:catechol 2,3-dioxygenase-like lactoylglutathione lyase family enzyme